MVVRMRRAIGLTTISGIFAALLAAPTASGAAAQVNTGIQTEAASAESGPADSELGRDTMPFQTASQQTSSSFWVLLSVWHHVEDNDLGRGSMGLKEEDDLQQWGTDYGRDLPSDREVEQFDDALFYIGDMLRHAQNDIGPGLAARDLTAGYLTLSQGGGPVEGQEDVRDAMQQDWEDAVSQLPVEDVEDYAEDIVTTARQWALQGSSTGKCTPVASPDEDDSDTDASGGADSGVEIPSEYEQAVESAAEYSGFPPELIAAQIQQESGWSTDATSTVGAQGIAQFMPDTWAEFGEGDIDDPEASIEAQGAYMRHLREMVEPHADSDEHVIELSLAAYNAGPGAVESNGWSVPPFEETEGYVVAIPEMANEAGGELVVSASSGGCDDYDVPDLSDVDCEAYESGTHYDYQQGPQYPILLEDALHPAAHGGMACGVVAFHQDYDGQLPQIGGDSPFGTRSENNWGADDVTTQIPSSVGDDHPWGGAIDVALDHQYEGGQFYWSQQGQEYGREIAEFYMDNAEELNVHMVIFWEKQWMAGDGSKSWDEWDDYRGTATGWSPTDSFGQDHDGPIESSGADNAAHRNHPHISFDPG